MDRVPNLDFAPSPPRGHCCGAMTRAVDWSCAEHPDRFDCPEALVHWSAQLDEYGLIVHDGGRDYVLIRVCPWCGAPLAFSRRGRWFEELAGLGFDDPAHQEIPERYRSDAWHRSPAA